MSVFFSDGFPFSVKYKVILCRYKTSVLPLTGERNKPRCTSLLPVGCLFLLPFIQLTYSEFSPYAVVCAWNKPLLSNQTYSLLSPQTQSSHLIFHSWLTATTSTLEITYKQLKKASAPLLANTTQQLKAYDLFDVFESAVLTYIL